VPVHCRQVQPGAELYVAINCKSNFFALRHLVPHSIATTKSLPGRALSRSGHGPDSNSTTVTFSPFPAMKPLWKRGGECFAPVRSFPRPLRHTPPGHRGAAPIRGSAHREAGGFAPGVFVLLAAGQISLAAGSTCNLPVTVSIESA
jgi:hypothetical protein